MVEEIRAKGLEGRGRGEIGGRMEGRGKNGGGGKWREGPGKEETKEKRRNRKGLKKRGKGEKGKKGNGKKEEMRGDISREMEK